MVVVHVHYEGVRLLQAVLEEDHGAHAAAYLLLPCRRQVLQAHPLEQPDAHARPDRPEGQAHKPPAQQQAVCNDYAGRFKACMCEQEASPT